MFTVRFQDGSRDISLTAEGRPVALPPTVRVRRQSIDYIEIEPTAQGIGTDGADILVGELPIPFETGGRINLRWLALPPPPPLELRDVSTMWSRIQELGYPMPKGNAAQGLHSASAVAATDSPSPGLELLPHAHAAAVGLLGAWPSVETSTYVWRPVDVPGGRENERATEKLAGRWPAVRRSNDVLVPGRTARVVPSTTAWASSSLSGTAVKVHRILEELGHTTGWDVPSRRTFDLLARRAWPPSPTTDPPLSSWPQVAADALRSMRALLATLESAASGPRRAPLSYLWRLYEAWVAAELGHALSALPGVVAVEPPQPGSGCDWHAKYQLGTGELLVAAQARLAATPTSCPPLVDVGLRSVTSVLIPDLLVAWRASPTSEWMTTAFDAKHRIAGQPMDAGAAAEAGSKYLWGLRRGADDRGVNRVVIVSTERTGAMFSDESRIAGVRMLPLR
jgi:hypothetical protein